jgi:hypothetical protein
MLVIKSEVKKDAWCVRKKTCIATDLKMNSFQRST